MSKRDSNWYVPADWLWHWSMLLTIPCTAILAGMLLPIVVQLKETYVGLLYGVGLVTGIAGISLLFFARLPLYRERRCWQFGSQHLDRKHRRLYWLAYGFVAISLLVLCVVWLRTR